ncbi:MAG: type II toxin-antitoxin system RelE/ParE family toxin [Candidatus Taylorbacteria bacterium]|nr:type II toxin-antitoxin system RelE/ParE family toxin [Candidatus Taylorbacteria bacterium]
MHSNEIWSVGVDPSVRKTLKRFNKKDVRKILAVFEGLSLNPYSGDIEKLKGGENKWRRRIGVYRIFYQIYQSSRTVYVAHIERRGSHTY